MSDPINLLSPVLQNLLAALPELFPGEQPIPLKNIHPNPDNPGAAITEDQIQELAENMQTRGLLNAIRVNPDKTSPLAGDAQPHPDNFRLKADGQPWKLEDFNFVVLTGENRYRAALWLKWETIKGAILNPTAKEAVVINHLDNDVRERGWWASYQSIENLIKADPHLTQREIGAELKMDLKKVNRALSLLPLLNAEARALIVGPANNSNKGNKGISERAAVHLADLGPDTGLKRGVKGAGEVQAFYPYPPIPPETQDLVYRALVEAVDHQMTEAQVAKLVEKVKAGNSGESHNEPAKASTSKPQAESVAAAHPVKTAPSTDSPSEPTQPVAAVSHSPKPAQSAQAMGSAETALYEAVAGMSVIAKIRSKIKKGERPNLFEMFLLAGNNLWRGLVWLVREGFKLTKLTVKWTFKVVKFVWRVVFDALKTLGIYQFVKAVFVFAFLIALFIGGWYMHEHGTRGLVHLVYSKIWHPSENPDPIASAPIPVPTSIPTVQPAKMVVAQTKPEVKKVKEPVNDQTNLATKAWVPDEETQTNLESEIASLPKNCVVEPLSFQPNTGINGAMAARRLQDLTDPDKYKLLFGHDVQKVMAIDADTTSLNITYQNGLIGFVTGGTSKMDFYWEDVRAIHCCQIESTDQPKGHPLYQCSLVLADAKRPFVIQCPSATNFGRLVSALVFWIQLSANKNVAVTGLPYLNQGLMMNDDRVITQVWAKSPADLAGLKCKDHLWSVGINTRDPQDKKIILSALQGPGPITLFSVNPANWDKANIEMTMNNSHNFNPKREKKNVVP